MNGQGRGRGGLGRGNRCNQGGEQEGLGRRCKQHGLGGEMCMQQGQGNGERRGRGGRIFNHGDLRLITLMLLGEKPRHGYEIIKAIEESVGGAYVPSPGIVYPTLTMLEELGQATVEAQENGKKLYSLTREGKAYLQEQAELVRIVQDKMIGIKKACTSASAPEIQRAMEGLRLALHLRFGRTPELTVEQRRTIADGIDAVTRGIEIA